MNLRNLPRVPQGLYRFLFQSLPEQFTAHLIGAFLVCAVGLVFVGFVAAFHACRRFLLLPVFVCALCAVPSCAHQPQPCICAPAPDPRVLDLQREVDRGQAEISRLRDRIQADVQVDQEEAAAPIWIYPKIQPGGAK